MPSLIGKTVLRFIADLICLYSQRFIYNGGVLHLYSDGTWRILVLKALIIRISMARFAFSVIVFSRYITP